MIFAIRYLNAFFDMTYSVIIRSEIDSLWSEDSIVKIISECRCVLFFFLSLVLFGEVEQRVERESSPVLNEAISSHHQATAGNKTNSNLLPESGGTEPTALRYAASTGS
jgi:hypothetical protein